MKKYIDKSAFYHYGKLPEVCIHSPIKDQYSDYYIPRVKCNCGSDEWIEEGCTMIIAHYPDNTPMYKDVHRCKKCHEVRMADHVDVQKNGEF